MCSCREELRNTESAALMQDKLREKVSACVSKQYQNKDKRKSLKMKYVVRLSTPNAMSMNEKQVCEKTFMTAWGITDYAIKVISSIHLFHIVTFSGNRGVEISRGN